MSKTYFRENRVSRNSKSAWKQLLSSKTSAIATDPQYQSSKPIKSIAGPRCLRQKQVHWKTHLKLQETTSHKWGGWQTYWLTASILKDRPPSSSLSTACLLSVMRIHTFKHPISIIYFAQVNRRVSNRAIAKRSPKHPRLVRASKSSKDNLHVLQKLSTSIIRNRCWFIFFCTSHVDPVETVSCHL